jgi:ribosomal protein L37E
MIKGETPTLTHPKGCPHCGSNYYKHPALTCFWCGRPREDLRALLQPKKRKLVRKKPVKELPPKKRRLRRKRPS